MRKWFMSLGCTLVLAQVISAQGGAGGAGQPGQPGGAGGGGAGGAGGAAPAIQVQIEVAQPGQVEVLRVARADMAMPFMPRTQLTQVDAVFVGKVVGIEPVDVEAVQVPGQAMVKYRIAVVQISDALHGVKKETKQVRIGFVVQQQPNPGVPVPPGGGIQILPAPAPGQPAIQPVPPGGFRGRPFPGVQQMQLTMNQEGLFTINKHPKENFYVSPNFQQFVQKEGNPGFDNQVKTAKQLAKVMGDPVAALKSEDKDDRYAAAAILIGKYRNPNNAEGKPMKLEPIDANESKLLLKALAGGDWKVGVFNPNLPGPAELFNQLGIQPKDGYTPNFRDQQTMHQQMQKWLDENQGKYLVQKYVVDPNAKVPMPLPGGPRPGVIRPGVQPLPPIQIQPGQVQPLPAPVPPIQDLPALPQEK